MAGGEVRPMALGTAGHIDHGKTALVEALTGVNTDRLAEERRRGISIELGFAELPLPDGSSLSVIDVPGHERLVRTMVAGATGVDLFLLVVAADDGVMPQTREHLAVLRALGLEHGLVAITKVDRATAAARERAVAEARALLPGRPLAEVSARTGEGLERLRRAIMSVRDEAAAASPPPAAGPPLMHVDRVFTLPGIGTVVTGTLRAGALAVGDRVEIVPRGRVARIRSLQVHGGAVERAVAGSRVALALTGVRRSEVARGDAIAGTELGLAPTYRLDVALDEGLPPLSGHRIQVHHGTRAAPARLVELAEGLAQLRLEHPLLARAGDRVVVRSISPVDTLGGALVLDPAPRRHGPGSPAAERLRRIARGEAPLAEPRRGAAAGESAPGRRGPPPLDRGTLAVLAVLDAAGDEPPAPATLAERLGVPARRVEAALARLVEAGRAVRLKPGVFYEARRLARLEARIAGLAAARGGQITLAELRDALGTSRKYAQALLEHMDAAGLTVRQGDVHVLRRSARERIGAGPAVRAGLHD